MDIHSPFQGTTRWIELKYDHLKLPQLKERSDNRSFEYPFSPNSLRKIQVVRNSSFVP